MRFLHKCGLVLGALALNLACAISAQAQTFTFNYTLSGFASGSYVDTVNINTAAGKPLGLQCDDSSSTQGSKCMVSANAATLNVGSFKVIEPGAADDQGVMVTCQQPTLKPGTYDLTLTQKNAQSATCALKAQ